MLSFTLPRHVILYTIISITIRLFLILLDYALLKLKGFADISN